MSEKDSLEVVYCATSPVVDVVFVHGLTGDKLETWSSDGSDGFWPAWLSQEVEGVSVYSVGYPASLMKKIGKKEMDLFERAGNVLERLVGYGVGERPIVFVAHSLGGILVKLILRKTSDAEDEDWQRVSESTKLVFFLATPHIGADLGRFADAIPFTSKHVKLLGNETGLLQELKAQYQQFASDRKDLTTIAYYEMHLTKGVLVVSRESADPGVAGQTPIAIDKNHLEVCKPMGREDTVYMGVKRRIQKLALATESLDGGELAMAYEERSQEDRRDLLQKFIDADREHEYRFANNAQNGVARRYTRTGLLTAAREDHDNLLSEVETRFFLHVYHPLICLESSDDEIRAAIQTRVIDALSGKRFGNTTFDAKAVVGALYYLTEQCYLSWDRQE